MIQNRIARASALILALHAGNAVASVCTVTATTSAFGVYSASNSTPQDTTGTITVSCTGTGNVSYSIALSQGGNGSYSLRKLSHSNPSHKLDYNLYTNATRTLIWGDGTSGTSLITDAYRIPASGAEVRNYIVYGRIPPTQKKTGGSYLDTITVTVTY